MGYTTEFSGKVTITPPLNETEIKYLKEFANSRRMDRENGPYYVWGTESFGQGHDADVKDYNSPPKGQPGLWCQWVPTDDGQYLEWDGNEKFYSSSQWMIYIIQHFLTPDAVAYRLIHSDNPLDHVTLPEIFHSFTFDHNVNGTIEAQGEDEDDHWELVVKDNVVTVVALEPNEDYDPEEYEW